MLCLVNKHNRCGLRDFVEVVKSLSLCNEPLWPSTGLLFAFAFRRGWQTFLFFSCQPFQYGDAFFRHQCSVLRQRSAREFLLNFWKANFCIYGTNRCFASTNSICGTFCDFVYVLFGWDFPSENIFVEKNNFGWFFKILLKTFLKQFDEILDIYNHKKFTNLATYVVLVTFESDIRQYFNWWNKYKYYNISISVLIKQ